MAAFEWGVPFTLVTPAGTATFNGSGDGLYFDDIKARREIRAVVDPRSQGHGGLVHPIFRGAVYITATARIRAEAGFSTRRSSMDTLRSYLDSLVDPTSSDLTSSCRLRWVPSGASERMYDAVRCIDMSPPDGGVIKTMDFTLVCPLPYALDLTQTTTTIAAGASATLTNSGTSFMFPVFKANGTVTSFTLANTTTGLSIVAAGLVGISGGDYAEIDSFEETIYKNGNGADLQKYITQASTNYWWLARGANVVSYTASGGSVDILWQKAWS